MKAIVVEVNSAMSSVISKVTLGGVIIKNRDDIAKHVKATKMNR